MSELPKRPNILVILTDQQRFPTPYEPEGLRQSWSAGGVPEVAAGAVGRFIAGLHG